MLKTSENKTRNSTKAAEKVKRRTPRACDRCRLKKAKCDGATKCRTCRQSDSSCTYTAKRGREARSYYCQMRDVTEEALQRLYWACRNNRCFPGNLPQEGNGMPTTYDILRSLGLMTAELEESRKIQEPQMTSPSQTEHTLKRQHSYNRHARIAPNHPAIMPSLEQNNPSPTHSSFSNQSSASSSSSSAPLAASNTARPVSPDLDMREQFRRMTSESTSIPSLTKTSSQVKPEPSTMFDNPSGYFDIDSFIDTTPCAMPNTSLEHLYIPTDMMVHSVAEFRPSISTSIEPSHPSLASDGFLAPWPGTLAAAYQTSATAQ